MPKKMPDRMPERSQKNKMLLFSFFYYYVYIYILIYLHAIYTSTHYISNYVIIVCRGGDCTKKESTCLFLFLSVFRSSLFSFLFLFPCSLLVSSVFLLLSLSFPFSLPLPSTFLIVSFLFCFSPFPLHFLCLFLRVFL